MRDPQNLAQLCELAPEFVGFIFYPGSQRFVGERPDPALFRIPGPEIKKVGVFVNEKISIVRRTTELYDLDLVQLHGEESAAYCRQLTEGSAEVIKALGPRELQSGIGQYTEVVSMLLFDSGGKGQGGTGHKFDWNMLKDLDIQIPYLLSGGIEPGDAEFIKNIGLKGMLGVDINSRFEVSPGLKDIDRLAEFIEEIRK